jgi:hypothetical protein
LNHRLDEVREAIIHFELYRCLKNILPTELFEEIRFVSVEPEVPVCGKAADLVVNATVNGLACKFLVIEIKKKTKNGLKIFDTDAENQAKGYAKKLPALYYSITDGHGLRLFRTANDEFLGNYLFHINENNTKRFLNDLVMLHSQGNASVKLSFPLIKDPSEAIEKESDGVTKSLIELLNEVSDKGTIQVEQHGKNKWLNIRAKRILTLELNEKNCLTIWFNALKDIITPSQIDNMMIDLSKIPGFQLMSDRLPIGNRSFTPIYIKNIATEEPDLSKLKEGLRHWLIQLDEQLAKLP